ncbi:MAG: hypothetical protein AMXMBFR33_12360 [Candidatus Xenobia bacterium]
MTLPELRRAIRRRWLLVLLTMVAVEYLVTMVRPDLLPGRAKLVVSSYVSSAKLLLRPTSPRVTAFGRSLDVNPHDSETGELWFTDFRGVQEILEDAEFLAKVSQGCPGYKAEDIRVRVFAYPSSIGLQDLSSIHEETAREGAVQALEGYEQQMAERLGKRKQRRLQLITLSVAETSPEKAERLARVAVDEFLVAARKRAAGEYTQRREQLEAMMLQNRRQTEAELKKFRQLGGAVAAENAALDGPLHKQLIALGARRAAVTIERATLASRLADLKASQQPNNTGVFPTYSYVVQKSQDHELELLALAKIYKPDDPILVDAQNRRNAFQALITQASGDLLASEWSEAESSLRGLDRELARLEEEIAAIQRKIPNDTRASALRQSVLRLKLWDATRLELIGATYRARLQERQAEAQGTLVMLQRPQLGSLAAGPRASSGAALIAMLPVGFFLGVVLAGMVEKYYQVSYAADKIASQLGIELLAAVPGHPRGRSRSWLAWKRGLGRNKRPG